jgi:LCP family protein required for cell wall assembly
MRQFYRWMRRALAAAFVLMVAAGLVYYVYATMTGIIDEINYRSLIRDRDELLIETATALWPTIEAESISLASLDSVVEVAAVPSDTSEPTETDTPEPSATHTEVAVIPSDTPEPTETDTVTPTDTATATDTATVTDTPEPTDTDTPEPTQVAQRATLIPTNTMRPTTIPTNTARPTRTPSLTPSLTYTPSLTPTITPSPTRTLTVTPSPTLTPTLTPSNTATYTPSNTPTFTPTFTYTPTPTATFTPSNTPTPTPTPYPIEGTYATPVTTPIVEFPPRAPLTEDDPNIVNIIVMGGDARGDSIGNTDVTILVSVNKTVGSVAMWHIPRDLLVYIPGNTIDRLNRAYPIGAQGGWETGGPGLVKETILYNFGIEVDYYARVNFSDFQAIIERLGGLEISVDCQIEDWALISPDADIFLEESYERYTMNIGRQTLDPYYALWYARSRVTTSDLDRGRRQMDVLRAIYSQSRQQGLITQATELYPEMLEIVSTDMELGDLLDFVPLASNLELNNVERFNGVLGVHYTNFTTPDDGRSVLLPNYDALFELAQDFVTPPTGNRLDRSTTTIEVWDSSAYGIGFDLVASDRLAWEGFNAMPMGQIPGVRSEVTVIYDYTGATKGSALDRILEVMRIGGSQVIQQPDPNRTVDFRIEIGTAYNSCLLGSSADDIDEGPPIPTVDPNVPEGEVQTVG